MTCPTMVQVTNISPQANKQQMTELFSYLGDIVDIKLFPEDELRVVPSKVCFVNFKDENSVSTSLHLTNTIFIDRALVISHSRYDTMPVEESALSLAAPAVAIAANQTKMVGHTAPLLPTPPSMSTLAAAAAAVSSAGLVGAVPAMAAALASSMNILPSQQQPLISLMGSIVPTPPPLTGNVDPTKIEEIRRTVYVGNLNSSITADQVLNFFLPCGEIKYVRMAGDETQPTRFVFVEFARPESVPIALQYNGAMFGDRPIKVNHSKNAIVKPQAPSQQETQREVDEAMRKVKEATMAISASLEPVAKKSRSRSRSRDRRKKISHSRSHSRDRNHKRSRSRSPYRSGRGRGSSRSPPSRSSRRYHSNSRSPRRRSRSPRRRSRSPRRKSRSPRRRSRSPRRRSRTPRRRSRSPRIRSRTPPRRYSRSPPPPRRRSRSPRRRSRSPRRRSRSPRRHSRSPRRRSRSPRRRSPARKRSHSPVRRTSPVRRGRSRSPRRYRRGRSDSRSPSPLRDRKKRRGGSREKERVNSPAGKDVSSRKGSLSPSPLAKKSSSSSRKKERRHRSRSRSPLESNIKPPSSSSSHKKVKKKHRHRRHKERTPSPSPSPVPSPPAKAEPIEEIVKYDTSSEGSRDSVKSSDSSDESIGSPVPKRREASDVEEKCSSPSLSPSPVPDDDNGDSGSSYD